jgi:hypothetical protein
MSRKDGSAVTVQYLYCAQCRKKYSTHHKLFDTLYEFSKGSPEDCPVCGAARELKLTLDFQLGGGDFDFKVVSAFLPDKLESWLGEEEEEVTFYPFLVILQNGEDKQFCWMPYWHVTGREARFGQHAVCLDKTQLDSLMAQYADKVLEPA